MNSPAPRTPIRIPELERDFDILGEVRRSGASIVYQGLDRELDREVCIRVIRAPVVRNPEDAARIERESGRVAKLHHPNIVPLHEVRTLSDGGVALVSGHVGGPSLKEAIEKGGTVPVPFVRKLLHDIGRALDYAHRRHGVVHRQVKPEAILLDVGYTRALLADFDVLGSRADESEPSLTDAAPAFMSPEQLAGEEADARSDLYSLGLVAYNMLTGRPPWHGESFYNVILKQRTEELPDLAKLRPELPADLLNIVGALLRKDPAARIPDAATLLNVLEGRGSTIPSTPPGSPESIPEEDPASRDTPPSEDVPEWARPRSAGGSSALPPLELPKEGADPARGAAGAGGRQAAPTAGPTAASTASSAAMPGFHPYSPPPARKRWGVIGAGVLFTLVLVAGTFWFLGGGEGGLWGFGGAPPFEFSDADLEGGGPGTGGTTPDMDEPGSLASDHGDPVRIVAIEGDGQAAEPGEGLPFPIVVRVEDEQGRPVPGIAVRFQVQGTGAAAIPAEQFTDEFGRAGTQVLLGSAPASQLITAGFEIEGESVETSLRASVVSGPAAASLASLVQPGREGRPATELPGGVVVRAQDAAGRPVAGAQVRFQALGGGVVDPPLVVTGDDGLARASWLLGPTPGEQSVTAQVTGAPPLTFSARATVAVIATRPMVTVGGSHSCRLSADGNIACWGGNASGQLGGGRLGGPTDPTLVAGPFVFAAVAAGVSHTCGLEREGRVLCWGDGSQGQLGAGSTERRAAPLEVADEQTFSAITAGLQHSCALSTAGQAFCWGGNGRGQLGAGGGASRDRPTPVAGGRSFTRISAGWDHTCALTSGGAAYCWGANDSGQAGPSAGADSSAPILIPGEDGFSEIAAGAAHSCGISREGVAFCWGDNRFGQLGDEGASISPRPLRVRTAERFTRITAGATHSCGVTAAGNALCWGRNQFGQLGDGSSTDSPVPVPVAGGHRFVSVDATGSHTCGRTDTGVTYCWGYNVEGQLGDGSRTHRTTPVRSAPP